MKNAVVLHGPRAYDSYQLVNKLHHMAAENSNFRYKMLLYKDYCLLPGSHRYDEHGDDDLIAVMWSEPQQIAMGLAHTYTIAWDATHATNWLGLKYFDFTTIDDLGMLAVISQGLQRHEDNATSEWALNTFFEFVPTSNIEVGHIDGASECMHAFNENLHYFKGGWTLDEWHMNR